MRRVLAAVVAATVLAGCGGSSDDTPTKYVEPKGPAGATAEIEAGNLYFEPDEVDLPAGISRIVMVGKGGVHTLEIDGVANLELRVEGDERDAAKVKLDRGTYEFFCDLPGHREAGMEGEIRVS